MRSSHRPVTALSTNDVYVLTVASRLWILRCSYCFLISGITCVLPCPLAASPWTCFLSPHVWQRISWVTSSRDHLDIFRLGAGPEITPQGRRCHRQSPGLLQTIWAHGARTALWSLCPLRHTGASHRPGARGCSPSACLHAAPAFHPMVQHEA